MGHGRWQQRDWNNYTTTHTQGKTTREIFNAASLKADMDPRYIKTRESRDSVDNPNATPIILALDVTGSMGMIPDALVRKGLGELITSILDRKPVTDPHIMVMGVGDAAAGDRAPLQVSQFEADIRIAEQLKDLYLEGGGGGNHNESYTFPWYFAANRTDIDCTKHGRKGILFTFGDEQCPAVLTAAQIKRYTGDDVPADLTTAELLKLVSQKYDVYHVVIEEGGYAKKNSTAVYDSWKKVLPEERIVSVKDYQKLPEILVSVLEVHGGKTPKSVIASWQGETANVVAAAIDKMTPGIKVPGGGKMPKRVPNLILKPDKAA